VPALVDGATHEAVAIVPLENGIRAEIVLTVDGK
jgi:hypothetical protein